MKKKKKKTEIPRVEGGVDEQETVIQQRVVGDEGMCPGWGGEILAGK